MSILDKIKKRVEVREPAKEAEEKKAQEKKEEKDKAELKEEAGPEKTEIPSHHILKGVHITEKTVGLEENSQYVFRVSREANKEQIKQAVEQTYGVKVLNVNTVSIPPKKRRVGGVTGWRKGFKKAVVKIKEGQSIETI